MSKPSVQPAFVVRTDAFESVHPGADFINERCFGEDFARWLTQELNAKGIAASEPFQEDWGWGFLVSVNARKVFVSVGVMDESVGESPAEWRIGVSAHGIFRKPSPSDVADVAAAVEAALRSRDEIELIRGHDDPAIPPPTEQ